MVRVSSIPGWDKPETIKQVPLFAASLSQHAALKCKNNDSCNNCSPYKFWFYFHLNMIKYVFLWYNFRHVYIVFYYLQKLQHHQASEIYQQYIANSASIVKLDKAIIKGMEAFMLGNVVSNNVLMISSKF